MPLPLPELNEHLISDLFIRPLPDGRALIAGILRAAPLPHDAVVTTLMVLGHYRDATAEARGKSLWDLLDTGWITNATFTANSN